MRIKLLLLLLLPVFALGQTGMVTYDTTIAGRFYVVTMPDDWWSRSDSTSGYVYLHGMGEVYRSDSSDAYNRGVLSNYFAHRFIRQLGTWDGKVTLGNGVHRPVHISFQRLPGDASGNMRPWALKPIVDMIKARWRIKDDAIFAVEGSQGGWVGAVGQSYKPTANDYSYYNMFTAQVNIDGVVPSDTYNSTLPYPQRYGHMAQYGAKILAFQQFNDDSRKSDVWIKNMNDSVPGSGRYIITNINGGNHYGAVNVICDPTQRNWTASNASLVASKSGRVMASNYIAGGQNIYEWLLRQGDTTLSTDPTPLVANAGVDFSVPYSQNGLQSPFQLSGTISAGTPSWTFISGPMTPTITNSATLTPTITGNFLPGYYRFRLTATDGTTATDDVIVWVRDWMQKNVMPCRPGGGIKHVIGNAINGSYVTTSVINMQYINRDNLIGSAFGGVMGGDTIAIARNPNNGGKWQYIEMGDFGGNSACKVNIQPLDTVTSIAGTTSYFRLGIRDSNIVAHVKVDGLALRSKGITYGFELDNSAYGYTPANYLISANNYHDVELCGLYGSDLDVGLFMKANSDSSKVFKIYDHFRMNNLWVHDIMLKRIHGEGLYLGHTDIAGNIQTGNKGPTIIGDNILIERVIIDSTGWDGVQVSNFGYNAVLRDIVVYRTGQTNQSSQQHSILLGGNTQGRIYNSVAVNGTGSMAMLGKGTSYIYNNFIDSVNNGLSNADAIYVQQSNSGVPQPWDSLQVFTYNNITRRHNRYGVFHANNASGNSMKKGAIRNNIWMGVQGVATNAGDTLENNVNNTSYDYDAALINHDAYQVYKLLRANPGSKVSFFDLDTEVPPVDPVQPVLRIPKGRRIRWVVP
jgi:hypothetical protein